MNCFECSVKVNPYDKYCYNCGHKQKKTKVILKNSNDKLIPYIGTMFSFLGIIVILLFGYLKITSNNNIYVYLESIITFIKKS